MAPSHVTAKRVVVPASHVASNPAYSQGVRVGDTVYVSGQIGRAETLEEQAEQAFDNLRGVLEAAGGTMLDLVKVTAYSTEADCWPRIKDLYFSAVPEPRPASTLVVINALAAPGLLIEVEAVAVIGCGA